MTDREFAVDFLKQYTNGCTDCCVNYRVVPDTLFIKSLSFEEAVQTVLDAINTMTEWAESFNLDNPHEKGRESAIRMLRNHFIDLNTLIKR